MPTKPVSVWHVIQPPQIAHQALTAKQLPTAKPQPINSTPARITVAFQKTVQTPMSHALKVMTAKMTTTARAHPLTKSVKTMPA